MTKTQIATFVAAAFAAGAGTRSLVSVIAGDGSKTLVQSVQAVPQPDGGVLAETCGTVQAPGQRETRWCDRRVDARMSGLVADAPGRLSDAAAVGLKRLAATNAKLAARRDAGR